MRTDIYASDMSLAQYKAEKIAVLEDFRIFLNDDELANLNSLATEIAIDNFARELIRTKTKSVGRGESMRMVTEAEYACIVREIRRRKRKESEA